MGKFEYTKKRFTVLTRPLLEKIVAIVEEYQAAGYRMTLRQLYYQLVARAIIPNKVAEYHRLSSMLTRARMGGYVDWDFIEDRIRVPRIHSEFKDINELLQSAISAYRRQRWDFQKNYVEVWVEKDALSGVLYPITDEYHVRLLVNRGYSSASAMHDASIRFRIADQKGKKCFLIYLGDLDPSGEDMVRDVRDRLEEFGAIVDVEKVGLTMPQVEQYNPPPNPAKVTDSRYEKYALQHGVQSWELDALPPDVLIQLLRDSLDKLIDKKEYRKIKDLEDKEKERLVDFKDKFYEENQDLNVEEENKEDE